MTKQEYKILAGLVRLGKIRPGVVGFTPAVAIGRNYSDFPPALPSAIRRSWLKSMERFWIHPFDLPVYTRMDARAQWMLGR